MCVFKIHVKKKKILAMTMNEIQLQITAWVNLTIKERRQKRAHA